MKTRDVVAACALLSASVCGARDTAIYNGKLTSDMDANGFRIVGLASPASDGDAATKAYVDSAGGLTPGAAGVIATNTVDAKVASWAMAGNPPPESVPPDYASVSNAAMGALQRSYLDGERALDDYGITNAIPDVSGFLPKANNSYYIEWTRTGNFDYLDFYCFPRFWYVVEFTGWDMIRADNQTLPDYLDSREPSILARAGADAESKISDALTVSNATDFVSANPDSIVSKVLSGGGGSTPTPPVTESALTWKSDGSAIVVNVPTGGTLTSDTTDWVSGQAQTALITLAAGASVSQSVKLVGYGSWVTGEQFLASCVLIGSSVYVTPITVIQ